MWPSRISRVKRNGGLTLNGHRPCRLNKCPLRGFTLLEVVVAVAIMAILVSLLLGLASQTLTVWNRLSARLEVRSKVDWVLNLLSQDLEGIVVFDDGREWFRSVPSPSKGNAEVGDLLMFYAVIPDQRTPSGGDLCAVSYRLALGYPLGINSNRPIYGLYRTITTAEETFDGALDSELSDLESFWDAQWRSLDSENLLAGHVVDFRVIYHYSNGARSKAGTTVSLGRPARVHSGGATHRPIFADVSITVVADKDAERLYSFSGAKADFDHFIRRYGYTFSRRVPLTWNLL